MEPVVIGRCTNGILDQDTTNTGALAAPLRDAKRGQRFAVLLSRIRRVMCDPIAKRVGQTKAAERRLVNDAPEMRKESDLSEQIPSPLLNDFCRPPTEYASQPAIRVPHDELSSARGDRVLLTDSYHEQILHERLELGCDLEEDELCRVAAIGLPQGCRIRPWRVRESFPNERVEQHYSSINVGFEPSNPLPDGSPRVSQGMLSESIRAAQLNLS